MRRRAHSCDGLGQVLALLGAEPQGAFEVAERAGLPVPEAVRLLHELRRYGLAEVGPGTDGLYRWRRASP